MCRWTAPVGAPTAAGAPTGPLCAKIVDPRVVRIANRTNREAPKNRRIAPNRRDSMVDPIRPSVVCSCRALIRKAVVPRAGPGVRGDVSATRGVRVGRGKGNVDTRRRACRCSRGLVDQRADWGTDRRVAAATPETATRWREGGRVPSGMQWPLR